MTSKMVSSDSYKVPESANADPAGTPTKCAQGSCRSIQWTIAVVFCLSFTVFSVFVNQSWLFDPYGWVDQWGYVGHGLDLVSLRTAFPDAPSGDLLPVIWPSALSYGLFGYEYGRYLRDFIFTFLTALAIVTTVWRLTNLRIALIVGCLLFSYQYFLTTMGSSYTDGYVASYFAFSLAFVTLSNCSKGKVSWLWMFFAALSFGLMVYSAVLALILFPVLLIYRLSGDQSARSIRDAVNSLIRNSAILTGGIIFITIILQSIYSTYGQGFFYTNSIRKLFSFTIGDEYRAPEYTTWIADASWLIVPIAISFASLVVLLAVLLRWMPPLPRMHCALITVAPVTMTLLISVNLFAHQWSLQFLYFNQTLPAYFLSLAALLALAVRGKAQLHYWIAISLCTAIMTMTLSREIEFSYGSLRTSLGGLAQSHPILLLGCLIGFLTALLVAMVWKNTLAPYAAVTLSVLMIFSVSPSYGCFLCFNGFAKRSLPEYSNSAAAVFETSIDISRFLKEIDPTKHMKLWYSETNEIGPILRQVNAMNYLNDPAHRVSRSFPQLTDADAPIGSGGSEIFLGDRLLTLDASPEGASTALETLADAGFKAVLVRQSRLALTGSSELFASEIQVLETPQT